MKNYRADQVGVLAFLPWNDDWNKYMYPQDKAIRAMDLIQAAGIKWVRLDFSRTKIEPEKEGQFVFEHFDWLAAELRKRNISILGVLGYSPPWAASEGGKWNAPPKDLAGFGRYVAEVVKHYRGQVDHWEIWNEPNYIDYWQPQDGLTGYAELLRESYRSAKSANPQCRILNGGLAGADVKDVQALYNLGLKEYFDIINIHLIDDNLDSKNYKDDIRNAIIEIRKVMESFGDGEKEMWWTEIGSSGMPRHLGGFTEQRQAKVLREVFSSVLDSGQVNCVFWAFFQDTKDFFNLKGIDYYGLIRSDFSRKPAYFALKKLIQKP